MQRVVNNGKKINNLYSRKSVKDLRKNIGSLLKPLVYSLLLKEKDETSLVPTSKIVFKLKSGEWIQKDHFNGSGSVTLKYALFEITEHSLP